MPNLKIGIYVCLLLISLNSCTSTKQAFDSVAIKNELEQDIHKLVQCLNERDFDCVNQHYADGFYSMNPVVIYNTKAEMIASLKENYTKNNYRLEIEIGELRSGPYHAHALLRWKMFVPKGASEELIIDSMNLTIWEKSRKGKWQISRMTFFTPEK